MKSIPAAAFAIGIFAFGALAIPIIGPFSFLTAEIYGEVGVNKRRSALSQVAPAAVLLSWNTFGNAGTETNEPSVSNDPNLSSSNLTLGAGVTPAANANRFGGNNWWDTGDSSSTTLAQSIAGNDYIQFIVTPNPGFSFTPTSFVFIWDRSSSGPQNVTLRSSADGFTTDLGTVTTILTGAFETNTIIISGLTNVTAATTFRLYGHGATAAAGTGGLDSPNNLAPNVVLNGTVSPVVSNPGTFSFDPTSYSPGEGDGAATITVKRNGGTNGSVTVDYGATGVSATAGATCGFGTGVDYVTPSGTLTFSDGVDTQTFNVTVCDDQLVEVTESLNLSLSNPTGGATIGTGAATINILDNDVSVQFASATFAKREGSTVSITITRSGLTDAPATANYSVSGGNASGGTCGTAGVDFATPSGSVEFAIGETSKNIDIEICSDAAAENPNETFDLTIDTASGASAGSPSTTSVSILEPLGRALWVFGGSVVPNPVSDAGGRSTLVGRSYQAGVRELYVSVYQGTPNSNGRLMYPDSDMAALNALADGAGQEVWAAYGNTDWPALTAGCPGTSFPEARMAEVVAFNASRPANERFDGVMLDVEPSPSNEAEFQALIAHYECMRSRLPAEIKLGVAVSAFWDDDVIEYPAAFAMSSKPVSSHIIDLPLDRVVVMGYRDSAGTDVCPTSNGIICLDKDEIAYATSIGKAGLVFAGLETMTLPGEDNVTFNEEGQITMEAEAGLVDAYFNASSGLGGFAIHNYTAAYLGGSSGWPVGPTAAPASISGRVTTSRGAGIRGVTITVQDLNTGISRTTATSTFGYYRITGLSAGQAYIVTASSRKYTFAAGSRLVNLDDNVDGVDFIALP